MTASAIAVSAASLVPDGADAAAKFAAETIAARGVPTSGKPTSRKSTFGDHDTYRDRDEYRERPPGVEIGYPLDLTAASEAAAASKLKSAALGEAQSAEWGASVIGQCSDG